MTFFWYWIIICNKTFLWWLSILQQQYFLQNSIIESKIYWSFTECRHSRWKHISTAGVGYHFITDLPTHSLGGQYCFAPWRLSSSSVTRRCICNVTHQGTALNSGPVVLVPLGRHLVILYNNRTQYLKLFGNFNSKRGIFSWMKCHSLLFIIWLLFTKITTVISRRSVPYYQYIFS